MTIGEFLSYATQRLSRGGVLDPNIEAEVLIRHALGMERSEFFAALNQRVAPEERVRIDQLVSRRLQREPLAYIRGHREFYGLDFVVNPHVLIPRQETEMLVDKVLELFPADRRGGNVDIADVGTGSGAIAIAIASSLPRATLYATDASWEALAVADTNRRRHGVSERVHLLHGDLLEPLRAPVDVIVSNPPYIRSSDVSSLAPEVRREPSFALDGGEDGLAVTRRLLEKAPSYVRPGGCILIEISPEQLGRVSRLAQEAMSGATVSFDRDLLGLPRVVIVAQELSQALAGVLSFDTPLGGAII